MIFCKQCGHEIKQGTKFCIKCGTKIDVEPAQEPSEPGYPQNQQPVTQPLTPPIPRVLPQQLRQPMHQSPPQLIPAVPPPPPPPPLRLCTKCGVTLENGVLFCHSCGTKNYVFQMNKPRKGELLVTLRGCQLIKLQFLKTPGTLLIFDDRIFFQAESQANNIVISYAELTSVAPNSGSGLSIRLACINGKSYVFSLSDADTDFFYYVINLLTDYRF